MSRGDSMIRDGETFQPATDYLSIDAQHGIDEITGIPRLSNARSNSQHCVQNLKQNTWPTCRQARTLSEYTHMDELPTLVNKRGDVLQFWHSTPATYMFLNDAFHCSVNMELKYYAVG